MRLFTAAALSAILLPGVTYAQGSAPASSVLVGLMHAIHATNNVDTTLAFYTDVFGLKGNVAPFTNPGVPILTNSPGVKLRVTMTRLGAPQGRGSTVVPNDAFNFELTEFSNVERHAAQPAVADPGAPHMKLLVRDVDAVVAAAKKANAPIVTKSGAAIMAPTLVGTARTVVLRDPDGYLLQAIQVTPAADAPAGQIVGAIMGETVRDMTESMKFWHGIMGLDAKGDAKFSRDQATLDLWGLPGNAEIRTMHGTLPGSSARIEFMEVKGVPRTAFDLRVPDPGASGMAIRVAAIQSLLPKLKAQGVRVISKDGALVEWSPTVRNVFVKDPNGLNLELVGDLAPTQSQ
jgi:catechol 2,3-dioxygenase-like lactoylglutathione lyase family enzyme